MIIKKINKLLSKGETKKSQTSLDFFENFGNNREYYCANAKEYTRSAIVHRCVSLIAQSASHVPWKIYRNEASRRVVDEKHPVNKILKRPNADMAEADFITDVVSNLLLYGNSYILTNHHNNLTMSEIYSLNPEYVSIVFRNNKPVAYKYSVNGTEQIFPIDQITKKSRILHIKNYNPDSRYYGLSPLKAASKAINLHNQTMEWNRALLKNSTRPSGALIFQNGDGYLSDEQFERLKEQFYDNFSGSSNSGKPLILEGGLKWQDTSGTERLEKFLELKDSSARDIAMAFNIPPQLLGINGDNTYSNMQEARLALWEENIVLMLDKLSDSFSNWFSYWFSEDLVIDFDRDAISALTEKRENLWSKIASCNFMTINEKRSLVGLAPLENGDKID